MTGPRELALGLDIGGTSTRALVIDRDGNRRGSGHAAGANITSHAPDHALTQIRTAVEAATSSVDASAIGAAIIGTAGPRNLSEPAVASALGEIWSSAGMTCGYGVVADAAVAFAAGTPAAHGTLLLSGTGSLAAAVDDGAVVRVADGHGWLLGDLGSAFFLGREAVRVTLSVVDGHQPSGPLSRSVLAELLGTEDLPIARGTADELIHTVHSRPPVALAELAPLVSEYAGKDEAAARIVNDAAAHLIDSTRLVRAPGVTTPLVLAGGLLVADTPLAAAVRRSLAEIWPSADVGYASDGAAGAAWIAASSLGPLPDTARPTLFT